VLVFETDSLSVDGAVDLASSGLFAGSPCKDSDEDRGAFNWLVAVGVSSLVEFFLTVLPEERPTGNIPIPGGFARPPGGGDRNSPPMLTSCLGAGGLRVDSALFLCLALLISDIQAGCCGGGGASFGFGDSGLFSALSNQLDFVGLHLRVSPSLEGLLGGVISL
jgi:hypothetical protein